MTLQADYVKSEVRVAGSKLEWRVWWLFGGVALVRLALVPLNHPWDAQTFYNLLVDLSQHHSPYDTFEQLSYYARSAKINPYYEYFAYPPGLIYLYYPLARLYALLDPQLAYHFAAPGTLPTFPVPLLASLLFKLPVILADLATGWLLRKMAGLSVAALYLFNPYVLFMSSWMFDSLMVFCIVAAVYSLERGKYGWSALALAAGTLIKIVPIFIVPALIVRMISIEADGSSPKLKVRATERKSTEGIKPGDGRTVFLKKFRRIGQVLYERDGSRFGLVYLLAVIIPCLPFLSGLAFVLGFHGQRVGGGLNWQTVWYFLNSWFPATRWDAYIYSFSGAIGAVVLLLGLIVTWALIYRYRPPALATFIVALAGYLAFTKLVNEVYALPLVPLLLLQLARWQKSSKAELGGSVPPLRKVGEVGGSISPLQRIEVLGGSISPLPNMGKTGRNMPSLRTYKALERCYKLVWSVALGFALVNVPFFHFTLPLLGNLELANYRAANLIYAYLPRPELSLTLFLTGLGYTALCLVIMWLTLLPQRQKETMNDER